MNINNLYIMTLQRELFKFKCFNNLTKDGKRELNDFIVNLSLFHIGSGLNLRNERLAQETAFNDLEKIKKHYSKTLNNLIKRFSDEQIFYINTMTDFKLFCYINKKYYRKSNLLAKNLLQKQLKPYARRIFEINNTIIVVNSIIPQNIKDRLITLPTFDPILD